MNTTVLRWMAVGALALGAVAVPWGLARSTERTADYRAEPDELIRMIESGNVASAVDRIEAQFLAMGDSRPPMGERHKASLNKTLASIGAVHGHVVAAEHKIGDRYVSIDYMLLGEKRPYLIGFTYYRPADKWRFLGWMYGYEIEKLAAGDGQSPPFSETPSSAKPRQLGARLKNDRAVELGRGEDGWLLSGGGSGVYDVVRDEQVRREGHATLRLNPTGETQGAYGTLMRVVDATPYRGRRVRLSAFTRTEGTTQRADFWARVQAQDSPGDGQGLGGRWIRLVATTDWARQEIFLDVPSTGHEIQYGVGVAGPGTLWLDDPRLELLASDTAAPRR